MGTTKTSKRQRQNKPVKTSALTEYGGEKFVEEKFGTPVSTLRTQRCRGGGPPYIKLGRRVLYRLAEVEKWINAQATRPGKKARR